VIVRAVLLAGAASLGGCVAVAPVGVARTSAAPAAATPAPATVDGVPAGMQYLYGSGEAAAASRQAYAAMADWVRVRLAGRPSRRRILPPRPDDPNSVVLTEDATLASPRFEPCGAKPPAVVLDVDETALLNTGYEYSDARGHLSYDAARWERWERSDGRAAVAVPGAAETLAALRAMGVTVIFNSNRSAATASFTEGALARAGLGPVRHGQTLFLKGDAGAGSAKDARRARISARWCVLAMAGDQLGDFTDLFNAGLTPPRRRAAAEAPAFARLWGRGWFVLPNPVYGTALAGGYDEVFPADRRWTDPGPTTGAR